MAAQVIHYGGIPVLLGTAQDNFESLSQTLRQGFNADMLITSGGVSVGDYDVVKDVLTNEGEISFWTVRMKPGKPLAFGIVDGKKGSIPLLGLPGNPVSSMITFELFVRPAILKMLGKKHLGKPIITAIMQSPVENDDGRRIFARVSVTKQGNEYFASLTGPQGSGILTSMTQADGLAIIPEDVSKVELGDRIEVMMLDWDKTQTQVIEK